MPATPTALHSFPADSSPAPRTVLRRSGRACPACLETHCTDPAECLYFLISRPWADCTECDGSGWAEEDDYLALFCRICEGSGLNEYGPDEISHAQIGPRTRARIRAHTNRLTAEVSDGAAVAA